jgi:hypothetical protein
VYSDSEIRNSIKSNPAIIELGQHAKLKGVVQDALSPIHILVGTVLKKSIFPPASTLTDWSSTSHIKELHTHVESIWQVYRSLISLNSVGLPLVPFQIQKNGHLVTLFQGNKPVAEGYIIWPHPHFIKVIDNEPEHGTSLRQINITASRSLIKLTTILVPGCIHRLHSQSIQWIFDHGRQAVVTTSTLRTCNATPPILRSESSPHVMLADPAPLPPPTADELPFTLSIPGEGETWSQLVDDEGDHETDDDTLQEEVNQVVQCILKLSSLIF